MIESSYGTNRYLIHRYASEGDVYTNLPLHQLINASTVHPPARKGMASISAVDLDDQQAQTIQRERGTIRMCNISKLSLGLADSEPELPFSNGDAEDWMRDLPEVRDPGELGPIEDVPRAFTTLTNQTVRTSRFWKPGPTLDQNGEYSSVAFSLVHHLNALPRRNGYDAAYSARLHNRIVRCEEKYYGEGSPGGPSMDAGMRALKEMGHVNQFRYALTFDSLCKWLLYRGGVSLGMDCYEGMMMPDAQGFVRPTGKKLGRIALFCRGVSAWGALRLQYSYGSEFCHRGFAWLSKHDAQWLMKSDVNFRAVCWREAKAK